MYLNLFPKHLGPVFLEILSDLTKRRLAAKSKKDPQSQVTAGALKITINSLYGLLGDKNKCICSFRSMYGTTINGQLFALMLAERLNNVDGMSVFYYNTDGISVKVRKDLRSEFERICKEFNEEVLPIDYELADYQKCIFRGVNEYIILKKGGGFKQKGSSFVHKVESHKDPSFLIIPKALEAYFVHGIKPEEFIKNHTDIYDFCGRLKVDKRFFTVYQTLTSDGIKEEILSPMTRYFMSQGKGVLRKRTYTNPDRPDINDYKSESGVQVGNTMTIFNKAFNVADFKDYEVDYQYYIRETNKIITNLEMVQGTLF